MQKYTNMLFTGYWLLLVTVFPKGALPVSHTLPPPSLDITTASVWKCASQVDVYYLRELYSNRATQLVLEILHWTLSPEINTVEFVSSINNTVELQRMGLENCTLLAQMQDLISSELTGNWHNLKHHVDNGHTLPDKIREVIAGQKYKDESLDRRILRRSVKVSTDGDNKCHEEECDKEASGDKEDEDTRKWFSQYHNLSATYHWYHRLSQEYPHIITLNQNIGKSYHDREIIALRFTDKSEKKTKPKIYLQCLLHSREWISGSVCMYLAHRLATPHPADLNLLRLLKDVEFVIVPVANPDGYYATWVQYPKYRLWRKNVQPVEKSDCAGVDLNRNFDSHWDQDTYSRSDDPCSELYHGSSPGSELEVKALTRYIKSLGKVLGAVDFHSYHQKILYPPAFSGKDVGDLSRIIEAAEIVASSASEGGHTYTPHKMFDLYSAAGTFADWLLDYRDSGVSDSDGLVPLTVELRPHPNNNTTTYTGFMLPTSEILPTCHEMYSALLAFSQYLTEK